jgi:AcrR family transcriptional regulator
VAERLDRDTRRQQILAAAAAVIARQGYHGARMDDVVAEAGLSKGAIYWHFRSKDEIAVALVGYLFDQEFWAIPPAPDEVPIRDRFLALVDKMADHATANPEFGTLAFELYSLARRLPQLAELLEQNFHRTIADAAALLDEGVRRGELAKIDTRVAAETLVATIDGIIAHWTLAPPKSDLRERLRAATGLVFDGLAQA